MIERKFLKDDQISVYLYLTATAVDATCRLSVSHRAVIVDLMTADGEMNA